MSEAAKFIDLKYTYKDYIKWDDGEKWELINGEAFNMSPSPSRKHQELSAELFGRIWNYLNGKPCRVYAAPLDVRLTEVDESDELASNVVQPDIIVVCDNAKLDDRGVKGAPDLVIEIVSPTSVAMDYIKKLELYEKNKVKEYWIVHPIDKIVMIYKIGEDGKYSKPAIYSQQNKVEVGIFSGELIIDLSEVFKDYNE